MTLQCPTLRPTATSGFALALALVAVVLLAGFASLALQAASAQLRLAGDLRLAVEGDLLVAGALAQRRMNAESLMARLIDGGRIDFAAADLGRGWRERSWASRRGPLVQLSAEVTLGGSDRQLLAARRATLLFRVVAADTLRVSGYRSRY